jgi:hypothetical protein
MFGADWLNGSEREPLTALEPGLFRLGDEPWTPERMRFDTVVDGAYQRAIYSGTPYCRAFPRSVKRPRGMVDSSRRVTSSGRGLRVARIRLRG